MPFKLTLVSDVRSFLKGTDDIEKSLDGVADSLDKLANDTQANAAEAADALKTEFTDAFDKVKTEAKTTARKVGDDFQQGTREATSGVSELKDEVKGSAREMAASFDGSAESIVSFVQEIAANALPALGPAGAAAGLAAGVGIGLITAALTGAQEATEATRVEAIELGKAFDGAADRAKAIGDNLNDSLSEAAGGKPWAWMGNIDRLTLWQKAVEQIGVTQSDVLAAASGDAEAYARVWDQASSKAIDGSFGITKQFLTDLEQQGRAVTTASEWAATYSRWKQSETGATRDLSIELDKAAQRTAHLTVSTDQLAAAQEQATGAADSFSSSLTSNLSVADEGLDKFVKRGKLRIREWAEALRDRATQNTRVKDFVVDVDTKLSPAALQNLEQLPIETQALIAKAYKEGGKSDKKRILANLEAEAKVDKVTVDTSKAKVPPIEVQTTVLSEGAVKGTAEAATAAQREANRQANRIEFPTHIDRDELQREVNRVAASITPPTIYANVKPRKEVP